MSAQPAVTAEAAATSSSTLSLLASSLSLTSKAWSTIKRAGACACCAARLAGCRDPAIYACNERHLRVQLDARFREAASNDAVDDGDGVALEGAGEGCCPLCLGLLQAEITIRMAPRPQRSSEVHGDHNRACEQAGVPTQQPPSLPRANDKGPPPAAATAATAPTIAVEDDKLPASDHAAASAAGDRASTTAAAPDNGFSRARMVDAIAECITTRGYSVTSFEITAAVPACLVLRDAAFLETGLGVSPAVTSDETKPSASTTPPTTPPAVVPVKEALKVGLNRALQNRFLTRNEVPAAEVEGFSAQGSPAASASELGSDFLVEVTAKAPEADAHAMTALLGGPAPSRPAGAKQHAWRGGGKWAKKRQRREEQRNPGLTVGAVKKGLAGLDDAGRERMRRWVEGLMGEEKWGEGGSEGGEALVTDKGQACVGEEAGRGGGESSNRGAAAVVGVDKAADADEREDPDTAGNGVAAVPPTPPEEAVIANSNGDGIDTVASSAVTAAVDRPPPNPRGGASGSTDASPGSTPRMEATCEVAVRRRSIHFWGRYTKHSRSVPQTPWIRGFFSVQEAVSEPFEAFSGCVEGLLHGAGREDVNVRMLGKGRPFCLELVDSLRTVDEVAARLPSLEAAINAAGGCKNAGGGVAVSRLRVAGPAELPSDVQAVGEGKRKHYRCVVWVSRAVRREEVVKMLRDAPEELVVQQATPIRVLHRRTLLDRPRSIFDMRAEWINEHFFQLDLTTSAGEEEEGREKRAKPCRFVVFRVPVQTEVFNQGTQSSVKTSTLRIYPYVVLRLGKSARSGCLLLAAAGFWPRRGVLSTRELLPAVATRDVLLACQRCFVETWADHFFLFLFTKYVCTQIARMKNRVGTLTPFPLFGGRLIINLDAFGTLFFTSITLLARGPPSPSSSSSSPFRPPPACLQKEPISRSSSTGISGEPSPPSAVS